ncbi:MAG: fatty acid desaturase family protein [Myxococcales bacterium]|nr:fatty acid desaturase family protein [Myxococcales bacterium]
MVRATELLTRDEIRELTTPSDLQGWRSVLTDWGLIASAFAASALWPHPLTWLAAVVVIGTRQLGLAVLTHEAAHRALFRSPRLNEQVGHWVCGSPIWLDMVRYREHHLRHHVHTGTAADPDMGLVEPFPVSRPGLVRKLLRDLTGLTGLRRAVGLIAMDLDFLPYTVSTPGAGLPPIPWSTRLRRAAPRVLPVLLTNLALLGLLAALGAPELYALWGVAWLTVYSLVLRVRAIAEHACMPGGPDIARNTRTVLASPLERVLWCPHHVNLHVEHHLLMTVPHWRLPDLHDKLRQAGVLDSENTLPSYVSVLRLASAAIRP